MWGDMLTNRERSRVYTSTVGTNGKAHVSHFLPNFIVAFSSVSVVMTSLSTLSSGIHYDEASNGTRPYILMMHLPFDSNRQSVYLFVIFIQFFYVLIITTGAASLNSVLIILMLYLGDEIDVICSWLMNMDENEHKASVVKKIIRKHQSVISFSKNVEMLYTYIALMLIVLNTLITCGLGFILVTSIESPNFSTILMKNLLFYCAINIETFVFCFAGEYISAKSREIGEAAYGSPWYQSKYHGRAVLFMIMRSQNQLAITMGKFMDLSLERFSSIIKASASYMSVLLAMY
ncbi:PREDICTED: odorant receptor 4-like [Dinoponera quadriceps]|uniref:Odorant receptor 4-like n=1 Tax=Dinoponera quadriceps TaxID=609295 RepID=A0A6P3XP93_DINQU|nr:PREDICTED: odorant receptor 4-like [Dinoponera quadriceps]